MPVKFSSPSFYAGGSIIQLLSDNIHIEILEGGKYEIVYKYAFGHRGAFIQPVFPNPGPFVGLAINNEPQYPVISAVSHLEQASNANTPIVRRLNPRDILRLEAVSTIDHLTLLNCELMVRRVGP
jgi:hypothetical protein